MVIWGMVYYCFIRIKSFNILFLFKSRRIKAQRAGWHCWCLRMSQDVSEILWRSRGSEADGSCYSALTA